jgi:hypothetical protein
MTHALSALALFTLRRIFTGRRIVAAVIVLAMGPALTFVICSTAKVTGEEVYHGVMIEFVSWVSAMLLSLVYAIALTSSELEDGTAQYVLLAALPKWAVILVQTLVTAVGLAFMASLSIGVSWVVAGMSGSGASLDPELLWKYPFATTAAILAYLSVFTFWGYAFRRGYAVSIAVAVIWEAMVVRMPMKFAAFTITNNVRALILSLTLEGDPGAYFQYTRGIYDFPTYGQGALFLSAAVGLSLTGAMVAVMNRSLVRASE